MKRTTNILDRIGSLIPGYAGYAERDGRRNCDKILRDGIVSKLIEVEKILYDQMSEALKKKDKELMNTIEETRKEINTFTSKVKFAPHGATGFFNDKQIKEDELLNIYQIDFELADSTDHLYTKIKTLPPTEVKIKLVSCQEILNKRNSYINEFK